MLLTKRRNQRVLLKSLLAKITWIWVENPTIRDNKAVFRGRLRNTIV